MHYYNQTETNNQAEREIYRQKDAKRPMDRWYEKDTKTNRKTDRYKIQTQTKVDKQSRVKANLRGKPCSSLPFTAGGLLLECSPFLFQLLPVNKSKNSTNDQEN